MPYLAEHDLYPLELRPVQVEKVWGGRHIPELFNLASPADRLIGEAWVVWDQLLVQNGALRGLCLTDLVRAQPLSILGSRLAAVRESLFPLLVKFLDARSTLSVQVHPDDHYAQVHEEEPFGKAEAWYVLDAEPGARLIHGVKHPMSRAEAMLAIQAGRLQEALAYVGVAPGDVIMNVPGTIHALGGGIVLYEVQQPSDLTYRLYDWDRNDPSRPLHIDKSLDVAHLEPYTTHKVKPLVMAEDGGMRSLLCACEHFALERLTVRSVMEELPAGCSFHVLTVLEGTGSVRHAAPSATEVCLSPGGSLLVPAAVQRYELQATSGSGPLVVIKASVPDLLQDIVMPLQERGVPANDIIQLGGDPRHSSLARHVRDRSRAGEGLSGRGNWGC
jgi:mannose-6-phosphate isomerase